MSFRLYIINSKNEKKQIFRNNDFPKEFINELENQGLEFEESFRDFKIKELQPLVDVIKKDFENRWNRYEEDKEVFQEILPTYGESIVDWTKNFIDNKTGKVDSHSLYYNARCMLCCDVFELYNMIEFIRDDLNLEKCKFYKDRFILKENANVRFSMH